MAIHCRAVKNSLRDTVENQRAFSSSGRLKTNIGLGPRFSTRGGLNLIPPDLMAGGFSSAFSSSARLKTNVGLGPRFSTGGELTGLLDILEKWFT